MAPLRRVVCRPVVRVIGACLLLMAGAPAEAQVATTLAELPLRVNLDDTVTVTGPSGETWRGRVLDMEPDWLVLRIPSSGDSRELRLTRDQVSQVVLRKRDSLRNGAFIGLGTAAFVYLAALAASDNLDVAAGVWMPGLAGAAAGAGLDALIRKNVVVMRAGGPAVSVSLRAGSTAALVRIRW